MAYTQEGKLISVSTPLGEDALLLQGLSGVEGISRLFSFHLELLSENDSISFSDIVGQNVTIAVELADGGERYFNGYVSRFVQSGQDDRFTHYHAEVVPWLWFLTRNADCRIFQNMAVPDIITQVFQDLGFQDFRNSLQGSYDPQEYCVQYRETHFNFVSRLMEQYGISYYFEHTDGKHTMVMVDSPGSFPSLDPETIRCDLVSGGTEDEDLITRWQVEQELRTGKYSLNDYNFETPSTSLLSSEPTVVDVGNNANFELYDYPGEYANKGQGQSLAKLRMQEVEANHLVVQGDSTCRAFTSGYHFTLSDHYRQDMNTSYVITAVQHAASVGRIYYTGESDTGSHYSNHFTCIPASVPFRPPRRTPKPIVQGPQTAVVVGKSGEEIWVDQYGRVVVQFFWDRQGKKNENSSCWIRVSQPWAGKNWGAMWIPRIGQEVIVEFLEGDPDRPIITGRVYNAEVMPPYTLPDNGTRSTFMSRSSKDGGSANYNEIRFEDKKGSEQIFVNAEKDMDLRVEKESREYVGADRHLIVQANQLEAVGGDKHSHVKGSHFAEIEKDLHFQVVGDQKYAVDGNGSFFVEGDRKEAVGGKMSLMVGGDQVSQVNSNVSLTVGQSRNEQVGMTHALEAGETIHLKAGMTVVIEAGMQLSLKGPGGFVDIGPEGVSIQGTMVLINSGGGAGSGPGASTQSPDQPDLPTDPKDPDTADDGSKGGKLNS